MITENVSTLKIHKLTQEQYDTALAAGSLDENAIYLTPNSTGSLADEVTIGINDEGSLYVKDGSIDVDKIEDVQALRNEMGLGDTLGVLPIENGGTGISSGTLDTSLLPLATTDSIGAVQVGDGLSIVNGILSAVGSGCKFGHGSSLPSDYVAFIGFLTYREGYRTGSYCTNICYGYGSVKYTLVPTQVQTTNDSDPQTYPVRTSGFVYNTDWSNSAYYFYWTA